MDKTGIVTKNNTEDEKISEAVQILTKALKEDKGLYQGYQANIAVQFQDEFKRQIQQLGRNEAVEHLHMISNNAAKNFLDMWCSK